MKHGAEGGLGGCLLDPCHSERRDQDGSERGFVVLEPERTYAIGRAWMYFRARDGPTGHFAVC
ncbi:MAG: hypothetical protein WA463_12845 [Terriglobales bacterium]